tara:strand:- start:799 stop:1929 length:1131 start_codon:yes stop_codon:yes gene_type:complete
MNRREELIRNGLRKWMSNKFRGILKYVTGTGKTFAGLLVIEQFAKVYPEEKILIVCPTDAVIVNFKEEFSKFQKEHLLKHCKFICYASIRKQDGKSYSVVILDEVHHITTDKKMPFFTNVTTKGILGLSASLTQEQIRMLNYYIPIVDELNMEDVHEEGFIAEFTIINYPVYFTPAEEAKYKELSGQIDYAWQTFHKQSWKKIGQRSRLVYSAKAKLQAAQDILELFPGEYGIIFSLNKKFSEEVADAIGESCVAIHSGHSAKQRAKRLALFSDGRTKVRTMSVPKIFDEGVTLPRLTYGVLLARYAKERQQIQTLGRLLRKDIDSKHSIAIRTYVRDSVEENWVKSSQEGFNVINVDDFDALVSTINRIRSSNES